MGRPIVPIRWSLLLLLLLPLQGRAQGFELTCESNLSGTVTLTLFDGDSTSHRFTAISGNGVFFFSGEVERPVVASLSHPNLAQPVFLFIENERISLEMNALKPERTTVKGSRSSSEYRSLLQECQTSDNPAAILRRFLKAKPESVIGPFLLYRMMDNIEEGDLRGLIALIGGQAKHCYHYTELQRWLRRHPEQDDGMEMSDFEYYDGQKKLCRFSEMRDTAGYTLVFVGSSWCDLCKKELKEASAIMKKHQGTVIGINLEDNTKTCADKLYNTLGIESLPFLILVDNEGIVIARDIRTWELEGYL